MGSSESIVRYAFTKLKMDIFQEDRVPFLRAFKAGSNDISPRANSVTILKLHDVIRVAKLKKTPDPPLVKVCCLILLNCFIRILCPMLYVSSVLMSLSSSSVVGP